MYLFHEEHFLKNCILVYVTPRKYLELTVQIFKVMPLCKKKKVAKNHKKLTTHIH